MERTTHRSHALGRWWRTLAVCAALLTGAACTNEFTFNPVGPGFPGPGVGGPGPFGLVFSLDASFQALHGGQPIQIALVRSADGMVMGRAGGTVSATGNPTFMYAPGAVMQRGTGYKVHYWIDSNLGGQGTPGTCDPPAVDHQWSVEFPFPTNDITFTTAHNPALVEDVCRTFS